MSELQEDRDYLAGKPSKAREEELRYQLRVAERARDAALQDLWTSEDLRKAERLDLESLTLARCILAFDTMFREGRPADAHRRPVTYSLPVFGGPWVAASSDGAMVKRILLHLAARYDVDLVGAPVGESEL